MNPAVLAASAAHPWATHGQRWAPTPLSGGRFFWLGLINVAMLLVFLLVASQRRDPPTAPRAGRPEGVAGQAGPAAAAARRAERHIASVSPALPIGGPAVRASDAEREAAADALCHAIATGRLDLDEGIERIDRAYRAAERPELTALLADLPAERPSDPHAWRLRFYRDLRDFAGLALVAALLLQILEGVWEMWPVAAAALVPLAVRWDSRVPFRRPASREQRPRVR